MKTCSGVITLGMVTDTRQLPSNSMQACPARRFGPSSPPGADLVPTWLMDT
eukprot:CAMPEP_0195101510 /NCGR_PEP_ID=MMETSP0448-20130528/65151_1 /TAXON_ID=66468 /ORGANISM="Heterocapsa triquestra, Strain CCMP 448" /LENGTH=50 /DNA_ID=CAMNT_0040136825 /DNA_START=167 /DNA_END=315 /DNA_ORIENTATION=+